MGSSLTFSPFSSFANLAGFGEGFCIFCQYFQMPVMFLSRERVQKCESSASAESSKSVEKMSMCVTHNILT